MGWLVDIFGDDGCGCVFLALALRSNMKQEPQIFPVKPPWLGLEEIKRNDLVIEFRTKYGTKTFPLREYLAGGGK